MSKIFPISIVLLLTSITIFGQTSHVAQELPPLDERAVENLYIVGKVWGYLKYHHPVIKSGCLDWDQELLDELRRFRDIVDRNEFNDELDKWVAQLDRLEVDSECGAPILEIAESARSGWIADANQIGKRLSRRLQAIRVVKPIGSGQHYVSLQAGVGNPIFQNESDYSEVQKLDWRYRMLALYRFWSIVEYWAPYRSLIESDFDQVLREHITPFYLASRTEEYARALMALVAIAQDSHTNLWSSMNKRPPIGSATAPFAIRSVEGKPIVWKKLVVNRSATGDTDVIHGELEIGDVIVSINGRSIGELIDEWKPYYGVSNQATLLRDVYRGLLRGTEGRFDLEVDRDGKRQQIFDYRIDGARIDFSPNTKHDREGGTFQDLGNRITYLKLSSITKTEVDSFSERAKASDALIIDIRGYPKTFVVFSIGQHLVKEDTPFVRFTSADLEHPGRFNWGKPFSMKPKEPFFDGLVVILVDEMTQSQAEYTAMAFRVNPKAVVIGSQTAGADGNISQIPLPGGHRTVISGIGVFYPDKTPTQKIGIVPDIKVYPTIEGIRAGRDEILEAAFEYIRSNSDRWPICSEMGSDPTIRLWKLPLRSILVTKLTIHLPPHSSAPLLVL